MVRDVLALLLADLVAVEGSVVVQVVAVDQAVIRDDRHILGLRLRDDRRRGRAVERRDDQDAGALGQRRLSLRLLGRRVALRVRDVDRRARQVLLDRRDHIGMVGGFPPGGGGALREEEGDVFAILAILNGSASTAGTTRGYTYQGQA